ncbi:hypothetical protein [Arthrobacter sp. efr-133-R2A-120]|uniref:hypothetical protein n=1 Tax=Arthrobacter sp. efr-133-R2A-120 TaxID=3040277 RepID=UPI00254D50BF|nr:hypothetical protein [Arthrobacter sp. efr-133-R2A-120]
MNAQHAEPTYFTVIGTDNAPAQATDPHYEYAGHLAADITAASKDVEQTKAIIWNRVKAMADHGIDAPNIIGTLSAALAIFAIEIFNPAVDILEELNPRFDYRKAVSRATTPDRTKETN